MKIVATSDCHGMLDKAVIPDGDVLIIAGDYCPNFASRGETDDARKQLEWIKGPFNRFLRSLPHKHRIVVAGNHDWVHFCKEVRTTARHALDAIYLEDSGTVIDGVKFYGSPHQPWFYDWAFNFNRLDPISGYPEAKKAWAKIPNDTNVLITHGPPHGILDECFDGRLVGCPILEARVLGDVKPKFHIFGHIHHSYGRKTVGSTEFLNVALCDESYSPTQAPLVFEV